MIPSETQTVWCHMVRYLLTCWTGYGKKRLYHNLEYYPGIGLKGLVKPWNINQDSWSPGRDPKAECPRHEAGVLTTESWFVVSNLCYPWHQTLITISETLIFTTYQQWLNPWWWQSTVKTCRRKNHVCTYYMLCMMNSLGFNNNNNNKCLWSIHLHSFIDLMHTYNFCLHAYHKYNNLRVYGVTQYVPSNWVSPAAAPVLLSGGLGMLGCLPHLFLHDVAPGWYAAPEWDSQVLIYYWEYSIPFTELNCPKMLRTNYADSTLRQCHYFCNMSLPNIEQ